MLTQVFVRLEVRAQEAGTTQTIVIAESKWPELEAVYRALEHNRQDVLIDIDVLAKIAGIHRSE